MPAITLYVTKTGVQTFDDARHYAKVRGVSVSVLVETLLDLTTMPRRKRSDDVVDFQRIIDHALAQVQTDEYGRRRNGAIVSKRPKKTTRVTFKHRGYGVRKNGTIGPL